jgi:hypothetical protein
MNSKEWREWKWQRPGDVNGDRFDALLFDLEAAENADSGLRDALDAAHTVLSDIYKREGKSFHGSRVKADIESIMPLVDAALRGAPQRSGEGKP